ncbi:hypothetical protein TEA_011329 [Camellia sinensis var. sinensis]|uniref:tRNA pseudouridine synthase n=1 Tax=Camellia sinensis var. sinensis TaxID=542762 RepID=A0A4S4DKA2_CAMSN|nr:hypothetical protein TEA_011329 [Camellia sinensis var. sinensis]
MTDEKSTPLVSESPKHSFDQRPESPQRPWKLPRIAGEEIINDDEDGSPGDETMSQNPRMQRYLVAIEYIGTRFAGAQKQPNFRTVVGVLEDAGVHALSNVCHVDVERISKRRPGEVLIRKNNCFYGFTVQLTVIFHFNIGNPSNERSISIGEHVFSFGVVLSIGNQMVFLDHCSAIRASNCLVWLNAACNMPLKLNTSHSTFDLFPFNQSSPFLMGVLDLPPHEPTVVRRAVNHFLQQKEGDIMVIDVRSVPHNFHARYKAQERTYFYRLLSGPEPLSTFEKDRAWHVPEELDILAMQRACRVLVGHHDFSSFRAASCQAKSPIRTLDEFGVMEVVSTPYFPSIVEREQSSFIGEDPFACSSESKTDLPHGSLISTEDKVKTSNGESNDGFAVRLLVGVLKAVGTGELTISDVERILNAKNVTAASPMAPACGLYLGNVKYDLPCDVPK